MLQIDSEKLFSNICDVYYATCHFWVNHMSQVLRLSRETHEPLDPCLLKAGFLVVSYHFTIFNEQPQYFASVLPTGTCTRCLNKNVPTYISLCVCQI